VVACFRDDKLCDLLGVYSTAVVRPRPPHPALQDASFTLVAGLADPSKLTLRSFNIPDDVLRHKVREKRSPPAAAWPPMAACHETWNSSTIDAASLALWVSELCLAKRAHSPSHSAQCYLFTLSWLLVFALPPFSLVLQASKFYLERPDASCASFSADATFSLHVLSGGVPRSPAPAAYPAGATVEFKRCVTCTTRHSGTCTPTPLASHISHVRPNVATAPNVASLPHAATITPPTTWGTRRSASC
jgi:hypothetical protein